MGSRGLTALRYAACLAAVAFVVFFFSQVAVVNATTVALLMLLLVVGAATRWGLEEAVTGREEVGKLYELSRAMLMDEARHAPGLRNLVDRARDIQIMIVADRIADQSRPV